MKYLALTLFTLFFLATLTSCSTEDINPIDDMALTESEIPEAIKTYISDYFPSHSISSAQKTEEDNRMYYDIYMTDNLNLRFNSNLDVVDIDDDSQLPDAVVPSPVLDYVAEHYPDNYITDWEMEDGYQEVELDNGLELEFTLDGDFLRVDYDNEDDDNERVLDESEIPADIMAYIATHFPDHTIVRALEETDDGVVEYEVVLSGNIELTFNSGYQIIEIDADAQLPDSVIMQPILDYVAQHYPSNFITDWELETDWQEVELNDGTELRFDMEGVFLGADEDDDIDDDNEEILGDGEIPPAIQNYVATHFPAHTIVKAVKKTDDNEVTYEIDLSGNVELTFDANYQIIEIDADTQLPDSVIMQPILDYVAQNYPSNFITDWELEMEYQEVGLNDGTSLQFTLHGTFMGEDGDDDGDDEGEVLGDGEIPSEIHNYVNTHFPNHTIIKAVKKTDDNEVTYEIDLSGNVELTFDANYQIIEIDADTQLPDSVIMQPILDYVAQYYPSNFIVSWELDTAEQQIELNDGTELVFSLDGSFIRVEND